MRDPISEQQKVDDQSITNRSTGPYGLNKRLMATKTLPRDDKYARAHKVILRGSYRCTDRRPYPAARKINPCRLRSARSKPFAVGRAGDLNADREREKARKESKQRRLLIKRPDYHPDRGETFARRFGRRSSADRSHRTTKAAPRSGIALRIFKHIRIRQ